MGYKDEWLLIEANDDMDEVEHREPSEEILFYRAVANGDTDAVRKNCELDRFTDATGVGVLSRDPIVNLKYHFVVTTAMITRMCRQHGMEMEQAFRLSDFYIQKLDDIHTTDGVKQLHDEMVMDYTEKMHRYNRANTNSKHINTCKEYIYAHIKERITIEDLADALGVSASYLSRLFKKEMGVSVSAYHGQEPAALQRRLDDRDRKPAGLFLPEPLHPAVPRGGWDDPQALPGQILYERTGRRSRRKADGTRSSGRQPGRLNT